MACAPAVSFIAVRSMRDEPILFERAWLELRRDAVGVAQFDARPDGEGKSTLMKMIYGVTTSHVPR